MAPVALSTSSHVSVPLASSSLLSSQFSLLSPPPIHPLPLLIKRNRLPSSAHLRCSSRRDRRAPPQSSSSGISLEHAGDLSQGGSGQAELQERMRAAVLRLRCILPDGGWWRLEEGSMEDGRRESRRKAVPVFTALCRLSTIQAADRVLVMDNGKIIKTGDHSELIQKDGLYAQQTKQ